MKRIDIQNPFALTQAVEVLKQGGLIVFPTETCYGLGADPTNPEAVSKLLEFKGARGKKAISIAVANRAMADDFVDVNEMAANVFATLLPGAITVVSGSKGRVDTRIEHERKTLGVRLPDHVWALDLVRVFGKPITATSANPSGIKPPYSLADFEKYTSQKKQALIDLFIDGGKLLHHPPSTIIDTTLNEPTILRQGEIVLEMDAREYRSSTPDETQTIAQLELDKFFDLLESRPLIIALQGDLGAGKTHFVKGVGKALGIQETINSPTYTLMHEFDYVLPKVSGRLYHIDTWRLHDAHELIDLGFMDLLKPGNVVAIEWMEKMSDILRDLSISLPILWVTIKEISETERLIQISFKK